MQGLPEKNMMNKKSTLKRSNFHFAEELRKNSVLFMMLIPGIICMIIFNYIPMVGVLIAFKNISYSKGFFDSKWVGLKNFEFFLKSPDAFNVTRNTVMYNLVFIIIGLIAAVGVAILLNEIKNKLLMKFHQTIMFLPYFLSWVTVGFLVYAFLNADHGFINNSILKYLGIKPINWYNYPNAWPFILVFLNTWKITGYNSVIYFAAIMGIDSEYYEAAEIDGATRWQQIKAITIPSLVPLMIILTILAVGKIFRADFGLFYQTTLDSGTLYPATDVLDSYVFRALKVTGDLGMASASGLYQAVLGFILVITTNYIVKKVDSEKGLF